MQNPSTCGTHSAYYEAVDEENELVREALGHISAEQDAGRLTQLEAAHERVGLLTAHLERLHQLRVRYLGDNP